MVCDAHRTCTVGGKNKAHGAGGQNKAQATQCVQRRSDTYYECENVLRA